MSLVVLHARKIRSITTDPELVGSRRKQMIETAVKLFVDKGFDNTTMSEIAQQCGMSKGSLYNYVGSKEDLIFLIQDYTREDYERKLRDIQRKAAGLGWTETLRQYIKAYLETVDRMQDAYNFIIHVVARLDKKRRRELLEGIAIGYEDFEDVLAKGVAAGEFKIDNLKLTAHNIVRLCTAWAHNRWYLRKFISLGEYIEKQTEFILSGLGVVSDSVPVGRKEHW